MKKIIIRNVDYGAWHNKCIEITSRKGMAANFQNTFRDDGGITALNYYSHIINYCIAIITTIKIRIIWINDNGC